MFRCKIRVNVGYIEFSLQNTWFVHVFLPPHSWNVFVEQFCSAINDDDDNDNNNNNNKQMKTDGIKKTNKTNRKRLQK